MANGPPNWKNKSRRVLQRSVVDIRIQIIFDPEPKEAITTTETLKSISTRTRISTLKTKIERDIGILYEMYSLSYLDSCPMEDNSTLKDHFFVSGSILCLRPWRLWQELLHWTYTGEIYRTINCMGMTGQTEWNRHCAWVSLYIASHRGHHELVARLIKDTKVPINKQSPSGWTALHAAARAGKWKVLCILLDNGANVRIKDKNQLTAFDLAREYGHKKCENSLNFCQWNLQKHYIVQERSKDYDAGKERMKAYRQTHLQNDSTITPWIRGPRGQIYTTHIPNMVTIQTVKDFEKKQHSRSDGQDEHVSMHLPILDNDKSTSTSSRLTEMISSNTVRSSQRQVIDEEVGEEKFEFDYGWFDKLRSRQLIPDTDHILTYSNPSASELYPRSLLNPTGFSKPAVTFPPHPAIPGKKWDSVKEITFSGWLKAKQSLSMV